MFFSEACRARTQLSVGTPCTQMGNGPILTGPDPGQVADAIVAHNQLMLIDPLRPASNYKILMVVIGASSDSINVPELEIRPMDSCTNDLGID